MCRRKSENCQQTWLLRQCGYAMLCWLLLTTGRPRARQMINQLEHSRSALISGTPHFKEKRILNLQPAFI